MKITKKKFIETLSKNTSELLGKTRGELWDAETVHTRLNEFWDAGYTIEPRSCVAKSARLIFSNGSSLYTNEKNHTYGEIDIPEGAVLYDARRNEDGCGYRSVLYYLIVA